MARKTIILSIILAITVILIPAYAEFASPLKQFNDGVEIDMINCNAEKILMISPRDKPVCVTSETSEKLLDKDYTMIVSSNEIAFENNIKPTTITEYNETTLSSLTNIYTTSKTGEELEKIPNPDGYWIPIVDKKKFTEHFLSAVDDEIIEIEDKIDYKGDSISTIYDTRDGSLVIKNRLWFTNQLFASVTYRSMDTAYDTPKQIEYVNSFMNKMGFKVDGNDVVLSESFIDGCLEVWSGYICPISDNSSIRIDTLKKYSTDYGVHGEHGYVTFVFNTKAYYTYSDFGIEIKFDGWTNHPELIKTTMELKNTIDPETAKQKAYDFVLKNEELNKSHRDGGGCEYKLNEIVSESYQSLHIVSGVPYYSINAGWCTYDSTNTGHVIHILVMVDAWTGNHIFITQVGGSD